MADVEEVLHESAGGRRIVRAGERVLRPSYPWSTSVHAVLRHLEHAGFAGAPRFLGLDADGRETLTYLGGDTGADGWSQVLTDDGLASAARLLRRYHDAVAPFEPPPEAEWSSGARGPGAPGDVILHGDPGPWNMVWRDREAVALIDWDHANPGDPLDDLGYLVVFAAPLWPDDEAITWMRHPGSPDRRHRLAVIADAYGAPVRGLAARGAAVFERTTRTVERLGRLGVEPHRTWVADGRVERFDSLHRWTLQLIDTLP